MANILKTAATWINTAVIGSSDTTFSSLLGGSVPLKEVLSEVMQVSVKKSDPYPNSWCLVYKGNQGIVMTPPGMKTWASGSRTMLVGSEQELLDKIKDLKLEMPEQPDYSNIGNQP